MARVTVTDCLEHVDNRFQLVLIASKRARQLLLGAEPLVERNQDKPTVLALREIAEGLIDASILEEDDAERLEFDVSGLEAHFDTGDDEIVDLDALEAGIAGGENAIDNVLGGSDDDALKGQPDGGAPAVAPPLETQTD